MTAPSSASELVNLREIAEIEIFVLKRMKELTLGDHASVYKGGFPSSVRATGSPATRTASIDRAVVAEQLQHAHTREFG